MDWYKWQSWIDFDGIGLAIRAWLLQNCEYSFSHKIR